MKRNEAAATRLTDSPAFAVLVIALTLLVLAGTILVGRGYLRQSIREQMARRDAHILYALWESQFGQATGEGLDELAESPAAHFVVMLETSRLRQLKQLLAARLFDSAGELVTTVPPYVADAALRSEDLEQIRDLKPSTRFHESLDLETLGLFAFELPEGHIGGRMPVLEVLLPIHAGQSRLVGTVQFVLDGSSLAAEFAALDRSLWLLSGVTFLVSGTVVAFVLAIAFQKLQRTNRLLSERTGSLLRANQELALAAKTTALGAVTSHLIHGLKNPLSGLQSFISSRGGMAQEGDDAWEAAISTARRMQNLVSDVVRVLREENSASQYELSLAELAEWVEAKMRPAADQAGVLFRTHLTAEGTLANRNANLIALILDNVIQNAIQATPAGRSVAMEIRQVGDEILCEVRDEGPGLPEGYRAQLFQPCQSTKEKGSGIGLAISKQLANYLGADLELKQSTAAGTTFVLRLPKTVFECGSRSVMPV